MTLKEIALAANGVSKLEMYSRFRSSEKMAETHYYDEETGLWLERGILLFRPVPKKAEAPRDILQVEG